MEYNTLSDSYIVIKLADNHYLEREYNESIRDLIMMWALFNSVRMDVYTQSRKDIYEITLVFKNAYDQTRWALTHADQLAGVKITVGSLGKHNY